MTSAEPLNVHDAPVIIYQMGKVGSTSLTVAIEDSDGPGAIQSHFLGEEALARILRQVTRPHLSDTMYESNVTQLTDNIAATRLVNQFRSGRAPGSLRVMTLGRDPLTWYPSELIQNFGDRGDSIVDWAATRTGTSCSTREAVARLAADMVAVLMSSRLLLGDPALHEAIPALSAAHLGSDDPSLTRVLLRETRVFLRPFAWFDTFFKPVFDVDVLDAPLGPDGTRRIRSGCFDILVIRYEDLTGSAEVVRRFLGLDRLELPAANVSAAKPHADDIRSGLSPLSSPRMRTRLNGSPYAERFGYVPVGDLRRRHPAVGVPAGATRARLSG